MQVMTEAMGLGVMKEALLESQKPAFKEEEKFLEKEGILKPYDPPELYNKYWFNPTEAEKEKESVLSYKRKSDETMEDIRIDGEPGSKMEKPNKAISAKMLGMLALLGAGVARGLCDINRVMVKDKVEPVEPRVAAWKKRKRKIAKLSRKMNR